ncbi:MAG: hypothetical protein ACE5F1_07420 [Planctomycetota bacterium]
MFGGITARGRLLVLAHAGSRGEVFVWDLAEAARRNHFTYEGQGGGYADAGGVALSRDSTLYLADTRNSSVRCFSLFGQELAQIGGPCGIPRDRRGLLAHPRALCLDRHERLWVTCGDRPWVHGLQVFDRDGSFLFSAMAFGERNRSFGPSLGLCRIEEEVWVADTGNLCLQFFREDGSFVAAMPLLDAGRPMAPLAVSPFGNGLAVLLRTDVDPCRIYDRHLKEQGRLTLPAGESFRSPSGLATLEGGELLVLDADGERVLEFRGSGDFDCVRFEL